MSIWCADKMHSETECLLCLLTLSGKQLKWTNCSYPVCDDLCCKRGKRLNRPNIAVDMPPIAFQANKHTHDY
eukprot:2949722-Amphidinium_carterae.1